MKYAIFFLVSMCVAGGAAAQAQLPLHGYKALGGNLVVMERCGAEGLISAERVAWFKQWIAKAQTTWSFDSVKMAETMVEVSKADFFIQQCVYVAVEMADLQSKERREAGTPAAGAPSTYLPKFATCTRVSGALRCDAQ